MLLCDGADHEGELPFEAGEKVASGAPGDEVALKISEIKWVRQRFGEFAIWLESPLPCYREDNSSVKAI